MTKRYPQCRSLTFCCLLLLSWFLQTAIAFSANPPVIVKGSAAKPYEKKKIAVFGSGGYLGACIFGFLQRAGSLYGTGIAGINSPRAITATGSGSQCLNGVLGKNFVLAQADESFVKLTDMTSVESIRSRVRGFDAVIFSTLYTLEIRPVTGGSYERTPNDKTLEFYMDRPRSPTIQGTFDPQYCEQIFQKTLEACREEGVKRVFVIETDRQFGITSGDSDKYIDTLSKSGIPYLYIQPDGMMENLQDYTYVKGVQGDLSIYDDLIEGTNPPSSAGVLYREDVAAFCAQSIMSLDWSECKVVRLVSNGPATNLSVSSKSNPPSRQWCVNSQSLSTLLTEMM